MLSITHSLQLYNMKRQMNVVEVEDKTRKVDAILYNLLGEYLEDGMDPHAKRKFQRWFTLQKHEMFGETLEIKRSVYEER